MAKWPDFKGKRHCPACHASGFYGFRGEQAGKGGESRPEERHTAGSPRVGGNSSNGANCGVACSNSNNAFSNSNANIGARLNIYT